MQRQIRQFCNIPSSKSNTSTAPFCKLVRYLPPLTVIQSDSPLMNALIWLSRCAIIKIRNALVLGTLARRKTQTSVNFLNPQHAWLTKLEDSPDIWRPSTALNVRGSPQFVHYASHLTIYLAPLISTLFISAPGVSYLCWFASSHCIQSADCCLGIIQTPGDQLSN